ncbi:MAG: radical SAM protein, partial [Elusimicrobia bacterium]|nr:radical SAM protein [Elusimicrobiota bacterium]
GRARVLSLAEAHEGREGIEHILRITYACNERCPFCFIPRRSAVDSASLERELDVLARKVGPRGTLTISGGEPALDPRLPALLAYARRRGLRRFALQTNGCGLSEPGRLEQLLRLGVTGYDVAFHAHEPALYDRITASRGQYARALAGLRKLLACRSCAVTACVLVLAGNHRKLPAMMGFLGRLARQQKRSSRDPLQICFTMLNGAGHERAPRLAVDLALAAPWLARALARAPREGLLVQRFTGEASLPACLAPDPARYASELSFAQDRVFYGEDFAGLVGRAKRPSCRDCPYDAHCLGVPAEYARRFGLAALGVRRG